MYFGNTAFEKYNYVNEAFYTKKQLQDPNILNKLLEDSKKQRGIIGSVSLILGISADIIIGIVTGSILTPLTLFIPFIIGSLLLASKIFELLPSDDVRIKQLKSKVEKLKENTMKMKDSSEKQKIISNCDKVLASINKHYSDKEEAEKASKLKDANDLLRYARELYDKGDVSFTIGSHNGCSRVFLVGEKYLKIKPNILEAKLLKRLQSGDLKCFKNGRKIGCKELFYGSEDYYPDYDTAIKYYDELEIEIPEIINNQQVVDLYSIDGTTIFYSPKSKMFIVSDYFSVLYKTKSLFDLIKYIDDDYDFNLTSEYSYKSEEEFFDYIKLADNK